MNSNPSWASISVSIIRYPLCHIIATVSVPVSAMRGAEVSPCLSLKDQLDQCFGLGMLPEALQLGLGCLKGYHRPLMATADSTAGL